MKIFLTIILFTGFCFAEDPAPKPLPKDVQTIVDQREKALQEARIAFDKAVFKANDDAVKKMEAQVKSSTQKGDLDGALASKKFVEDWNKEKEAVSVSGGMGGAGPVEKKDIGKMILGKWSLVREDGAWVKEITFKEGGKFELEDKRTGTWTFDKIKTITLSIGSKWIIIELENNVPSSYKSLVDGAVGKIKKI